MEICLATLQKSVNITGQSHEKKKKTLINFLKKTKVKAQTIDTYLLTNIGSRFAVAQRPYNRLDSHTTLRGVAFTREGLPNLV